ncbi:heme lyase CcmF/NrfE family subunit [Deltaproteobacteria bacterium TL4]
MTDLGYIAMLLALAVALYGTITPPLGVKYNNWNLIRSVQYGTILNFFLMTLTTGSLIYAFVTNDYSIKYVWENSSRDLPVFYKVTALWGGMDGSLLFWAFVQSGFAMVVAFRYQYSNREIIPYVIATLNFIMVFLLFLLVGWSNPLAVQAMVPADGRGLNPLLQHPAMTAHPPALYLGYIGFSVPFAFAIGAMIRGKLGNDWVLTTRRWTLVSWYFLTLGIVMGGQWAYEELGWGGFWAWDPVENASFMPWLVGTAFLHSVIIQEKRNMLKIWNMVLIIITFGLSILGTFIVRSGVLNSVHAFAQSEVGPAFLVFLAAILVVSFMLLFKRIKMLESDHKMESLFCKENVFVAQNILFVGIAFTVFLGTTFPLLAEALRGTKLSIQAPFFNAITAPMAYVLLFLMGVGTLIAWRRSSMENLRRNFLKPVIIATLVTIGLAFYLYKTPSALIIFWVSTFVTATIVIELFTSTLTKKRQLSTNCLMAFIHVIARNRRRYGGLLIHMGVVLIFIGIAGSIFKVEKDMTFVVNQAQSIGRYTLIYKGIDEFMVRNATHRAASIEVYENGKLVEIMEPAKSFYPTQPNPLTEVSIRRTVLDDLYLVFSSENGRAGDSVTLKVFLNPFIMWGWMSLPVFTLGIGLCLSYRPKSLVYNQELLKTRYSFAENKT